MKAIRTLVGHTWDVTAVASTSFDGQVLVWSEGPAEKPDPVLRQVALAVLHEGCPAARAAMVDLLLDRPPSALCEAHGHITRLGGVAPAAWWGR